MQAQCSQGQPQPAHPYNQPQPAHPYNQPWPAHPTVIPAEQQPPDHVLWTFFNILFLNSYCLGFVALIYSIKSRDCKVAHDLEGATYFSRKAKTFNIVALIAGIIILIIKVVLLGVYAKDATIKIRALMESLENGHPHHPLN